MQFVYHNLAVNENLWPSSMPCVIHGKTKIKIAKYGKSNQAKMKHIYRVGLKNRYGDTMQTVAGIHFNYSYSHKFWQIYKKHIGCNGRLQDFINFKYMALSRNALRYGWLLYYLFGASNSVCKSFLYNYHKYNLIKFDENTLYEPYATSLRMGDIGYQNQQEDKAGIKANYNSIQHYVSSLQAAMQIECEKYKTIGLKKNGKYQQLNTNILQIENEYYSFIRPKAKLEEDIMPSISLANNGIDYIEIRGIDINPFDNIGINNEQGIIFRKFFIILFT